MLEAKEIYKIIDQSNLSQEEKDQLHSWYEKRHTRITEKGLAALKKLKKWREKKIGILQNKVLRRLK